MALAHCILGKCVSMLVIKCIQKRTKNSIYDFIAQVFPVSAALYYFMCSCDHPSVLPQVCAHNAITGRGSFHAVCKFLH
jgi:hypothetical protein